MITSLPIPSGKSESDGGELAVEEIVGVDVIAVHPGIRMAVSSRIIKIDKNFFMMITSPAVQFYI